MNKVTMLVFVRSVFHEDMLCTLMLPTNTTGAELFKSLNSYIAGKWKQSFCRCVGGAGISHRMFSIEDQVCFLTHCTASIIVGNNNTKSQVSFP